MSTLKHQWMNNYGTHEHRFTPHQATTNLELNSPSGNPLVQQQNQAKQNKSLYPWANNSYILPPPAKKTTRHGLPNNNGNGIPNTWNFNRPSWAPAHFQFNPPKGPGQPGKGWHDPRLGATALGQTNMGRTSDGGFSTTEVLVIAFVVMPLLGVVLGQA